MGTLNMAELTAAAVVRIEKELLNSRTRNNEEVISYLKDSNRPREDFQFAVLQLTCNNDPENLEKVLSWGAADYIENENSSRPYKSSVEERVINIENPILWSVQQGYTQCTKLLHQHGFRIPQIRGEAALEVEKEVVKDPSNGDNNNVDEIIESNDNGNKKDKKMNEEPFVKESESEDHDKEEEGKTEKTAPTAEGASGGNDEEIEAFAREIERLIVTDDAMMDYPNLSTEDLKNLDLDPDVLKGLELNLARRAESQNFVIKCAYPMMSNYWGPNC